MTEKDKNQLKDQEIGQVVGGEEGGGLTVDWSELVCPECHGKVQVHRSQSVITWRAIVKYQCLKCHKWWRKNELVPEP